MPDFAEPLERVIQQFKRLPGIGQKSAQRIDAGGTASHPVAANAVQRQQFLLGDGFRNDGVNVRVAHRFEERGRIRLIGLPMGDHVRTHALRRQQRHPMAGRLGHARPMMRCAAGFHHDMGRRLRL